MSSLLNEGFEEEPVSHFECVPTDCSDSAQWVGFSTTNVEDDRTLFY